MKNLTEHLEIKHAMERRLGHGALKKFADQHEYSLVYVSQTMSGIRCNEVVLRKLATCLGCRVHGVFPEKNQ